ncbi:MAG TPA: hypothetical protein DD405_07560 [Desulfobacteraceae bacterium]|nr:hypothetical protein [Desulfobacteraceae bacterium]
MYRFAYPHLLILLVLVAGGAFFAYRRKPSAITFSAASDLRRLVGKGSFFLTKIPLILRTIGLILLLLAAARPQKYNVSSEVNTSGVDIILCIDTSGSMRALDFFIKKERVNRLDAVKHVVHDFISKREHDRIGLIVFGEKAFTQSPLTMDKGLTLNLIDNMELGMAGDSTAIGLAVALGAKRLKNIEAESRVLILLTDGRNNAGGIDPIQAAAAAAATGARIYAIGVGGFGPAPVVVDTIFGKRVQQVEMDLDEDTLKKIAEIGRGRYFRASDSQKLQEIYDIIDKLEKTEIKVKQFFNFEELYRYFLFPALLILLLEVITKSLLLRSVP